MSTIKLDLPKDAQRPRGDEVALHFSLHRSGVSFYVATEDTMPFLAKRAEDLGVLELDGETITPSEVTFGGVSGRKWLYTPSQVTHYVLEVPGGFVSITVNNSDEGTIALLEAQLHSLRIEDE
jgi:hypothetical protein